MSEDERRWIAVHEAGHAIMHLVTGVPIESASIIPDETSLGRVTPQLERPPEMRVSLILGADPEITAWTHNRIMGFLAGQVAEQHDRGFDVAALVYYPDNSTDYAAASRIARLCSESDWEANALLTWLKQRTVNIVKGFYFQRIQDQLVPILLHRDELSEAEVIEIARPIVAGVLDLKPKTRRGRRRVRWMRFKNRVRRIFHRPPSYGRKEKQ